MKRATSLYLDAVRLGAAVTVLLTHLAYTRFSGGLLAPLRTYGNDLVMVFFVLSGYVIAHTAATRDLDLATFARNRAVRLYSVAVPAIVLTLVLDRWGQALQPALYHGAWYQSSAPLLRVARAVTFTNELWFSSVRLFSNGPYWSLGYEAWYYALFAAAWYLRGWRRLGAVAALALISGPKIWLLLPVWLLGVWVWQHNRTSTLGSGAGALLWLGSLVLYAGFRAFGLRDALLAWSYEQWGHQVIEQQLRWSNEFLSSYVIGLLVACNFVGFHACAARAAGALECCAPLLRHWAGYTFSIYLFHYPLLQFLASLRLVDNHSPLAAPVLLVLTVLGCCALGAVTEQRKAGLHALLFGAAQGPPRMAARAAPLGSPPP